MKVVEAVIVVWPPLLQRKALLLRQSTTHRVVRFPVLGTGALNQSTEPLRLVLFSGLWETCSASRKNPAQMRCDDGEGVIAVEVDIRRVYKGCHHIRENTPQVNPTTGSLSMSTTHTHTHTHLHSFASLPSTPRLSTIDTRATHQTQMKPYIKDYMRRAALGDRRVGHEPGSSTSIGEGDVRRPAESTRRPCTRCTLAVWHGDRGRRHDCRRHKLTAQVAPDTCYHRSFVQNSSAVLPPWVPALLMATHLVQPAVLFSIVACVVLYL